jgi:Stage III sporulation protein AE (spore_III_AE).
MVVEFTAKEIKDFILPAILFMTVVKVISRISDKFTLDKLADFLKLFVPQLFQFYLVFL